MGDARAPSKEERASPRWLSLDLLSLILWRGQDWTAVPQGEAGPHVRSRPSHPGPGYSGRLSSILVQSCAVTLWVRGPMGQEGRSTDSGLSLCRDERSEVGVDSGRAGGGKAGAREGMMPPPGLD